jgi:prepilin-type processing-associated H-X9-DG protein
MQIHPSSDESAGFTFTDLLAVILIAGVVLAIPCLAGNRERLNRIVCLNNLRQMGVGSQMFAMESKSGLLAGCFPRPGQSVAGDDINWLYGYGTVGARYIQDLKTAICPSTQNTVRANRLILNDYSFLADLFDNAVTPTGNGHSYEVLSTWNMLQKTVENTVSFKKTREPLKGTMPGPSRILLMYDAMEAQTAGAYEDYPNAYTGHGAEGGNMMFCDGHAEWINTKDWAYRWAVSQDSDLKAQ